MFFKPGNATHWQEGATESTHICTRAYVKPIGGKYKCVYIIYIVCTYVYAPYVFAYHVECRVLVRYTWFEVHAMKDNLTNVLETLHAFALHKNKN